MTTPENQEKKRALFQKATGHLGLDPDDPELKAMVEWVRSGGKTNLFTLQSTLDKKRELFQKAAGLLGYHPDDEDREREAYRPMKEQLLEQLTEEELKEYHFWRSRDWCGTNWEEKDMARIKRILEDRNKPPYREPSLWQRLLQFLF